MMEEKIRVYGDVECDKSLQKHTTFRVGGIAKYVVYPKNELCLSKIIEIIMQENIPFKIFGKGSNILCSDANYDGVIICLDRYMNESYFENSGEVLVQAGCSIIQLAHEAMRKGFSGLEFASGIPGTVGGALFMNAGAYKSSMSEIVKEVLVLKDAQMTWIPLNELEYSYRTSIFQKHPNWVILAAKLQLQQGDVDEISTLMNARRQRRLASQPLDKPSAGSMFRNPTQMQAWELIEKIGFRGKRVGGAMVSEKHCNFIVNENHASASDIEMLVKQIQEEVEKEFNIYLKTEVEKFNWKI